jgi:AraC family transcriptional regulator of adaptative response / DNA-3-methyladenine glycosylase II
VLRHDDILADTVRRLPGLRVAGAFDGFELAVRTVLGQQVSVKGASTITGRWAQTFGELIATPYPELNRLSPGADRMAEVPAEQVAALGMVGARARSLVGLAQAVARRKIVLAYAANVEEQIDGLMSLPGIGHWTANYIAMRALQWPDAFPTGDLVLLRAARSNQKQLQQRSEAWRPWRAYAAHYLWQSSGVAP